MTSIVSGWQKKLSVWGVVVLWLIVVTSALAVVRQSFMSRSLVVKHQVLEKQQIHSKLQWESLLLAQSEWASLEKIEAVARTKLKLQPPRPDQLVVVNGG